MPLEIKMEELFEEEAKKKKKKQAGSKKHARLHKSFLHLSQALNKLHGHGHGRASGSNSMPHPHPSASTAGATTSFLSACMHPRTHSFSSGCRQQRHVAAHHCDDDEDALAVGFRSLRIAPAVVADDGEDGSSTQDYGDDCESEEGDVVTPVTASKAVAGGAGVAVVTFSVAPYEDFERSTLEMVDAHGRRQEFATSARTAPAVDWDFMEELLFCYLQLNDRAVHKDILRVFTDTVAALRRRRRAPWSKPPKSRRTRRARTDVEDAPQLAGRENVPGDRTS